MQIFRNFASIMKSGIHDTIIFCLTANCRNLLWMAKVILTSKSNAMKSYLPFLSLILLASCSTAYKSGQTSDDVYFSPARPQDEYVRVQKDDDRQCRQDRDYDEDAYRDDRYVRMRVRNRMWTVLDDGYAYTYYPSAPLAYSSWSAYNYWNYLYNPYCCCNNVIIGNPKSTVYNKPRSYNLRVFDNLPVTPSTNSKGSYNYTSSPNSRTRSSSSENYRNSGSSAGGFLRNIFGGGSDNSSSTNSKSYGGSSSSSNSSSGGSSSSSGGSRGNASRGRN